jgi:hypothetical protein
MRANGRMHKGGLRLLVAAVLASLAVLVIGVPGGGAATDPEVAGITCVLGDVGCFGLGAVWSASVCPYDRANQPVTCSFPAIPRLATGRTRVSTGVSCTFAFPLLPPFPPRAERMRQSGQPITVRRSSARTVPSLFTVHLRKQLAKRVRARRDRDERRLWWNVSARFLWCEERRARVGCRRAVKGSVVTAPECSEVVVVASASTALQGWRA